MIKLILYLLLGTVSTFSICYLYYKLTTSTKKIDLKIILIYLFGVFSVIVIQYYEIPLLDSLFFFLYFPIIFCFLNKKSFKEIIYYLIIVWACGIAADLLLILILSLISFSFQVNIYDNPQITSMTLTILVSVVLLLFARSVKLSNLVQKIYKKVFNFKFFDLLLVVFAIFILITAIAMLINIKNFDINILLTYIMITNVTTLIVLIKYKIDKDEMGKYLETLKENNNFYIKIEDENRIFRHNLNAKLLSIKSVSNKKAMLLIDDLLKTYNKKIDFSNHMKVIPYGLNGVIYQKLYPYLKELNIKVYNDIDYDVFDYLQPRRYNVFVEKMVLAIDNAIEASLNSKEKILIVNLYDDNDEISIEVKNTFTNTIDIDQLGMKNYSSKGKKRGLGLFSSFRDNEASLKVSVVNDMFVSKITAKKRLNN